MMGKIMKRNDFGKIVNYTMKGNNKSKLLATEGVRSDSKQHIAESFSCQAGLNTRIRTPVYHISLSFSKQDSGKLTDDLMVKIAGEYMEKIQVLAEKGNGNHAYIDNLQEANRVLVGEFGATLHTVAKDVKLQVEFNPSQVQAYRLIGYESRLLKDEDFNNDAKDAGDMGAGHTVTAFYEVIPTGVKNEYVGKIDDLKYQKKEKVAVKPTGSNDLLTVKLRYKAPDKDVSKKMELPFVDNKGNNVSSDFRFASAVAMFGQLLRDSDFKGNASYDKVINLAKQGLNNDDKGYRREFIRLVEAAKGLERTNKN